MLVNIIAAPSIFEMYNGLYAALFIIFGGTMNAIRSQQSERRSVALSLELRLPRWSSTGAAQAPLPDDRRVELRVGLGYYTRIIQIQHIN